MRWTLVTTALSNALKLLVIVVLGRVLEPDEFGVVAAALTVVQAARMVRDLGVGMALVQRETIEPAHVASAVGFSLLSGVVLAGAIFLSAPLVASFYDMPGVAGVIRELSFLFLLLSAATVSTALCQRELEFKKLALVDLGCYGTGAAVAIVLAVAGAGPHSLAFGYLAEAGLTAIVMLVLRPVPFPRLRWAPLRDLIGFGTGMTVARIGVYFAEQADKIIIGRRLDAAALGFYTRAFDIVTYPSAVYHSVVGTVLFPSFSKIQNDPERLGRAMRRALFANAVLLMPASVGLVVLAPELIWLLMGPGWDSAVLPFQVIAVCLYARVSYKIGLIILMSSGQSFRLAGYQFIYAGLVAGGALLGVEYGIDGVAVATAIAIAVQFVVLTRAGRSRTTLGWKALAGAHAHGLVVAATALAGACPIAHVLRAHEAPAGAIVIAAAIAGSIGFAVIFRHRFRDRESDWSWLAGVLRGVLSRKGPRDQDG
jgi:PST family polysaccharide transporter